MQTIVTFDRKLATILNQKHLIAIRASMRVNYKHSDERGRLAREWPPIPPGEECSQSVVVRPVVGNTNSKNRRSHNTAEPINSLSKVLHVLEPPKTQPSIIYTKGQPLPA